MDKVKIFELEINSHHPSGNSTFAEVSLPATPYELADALNQARISDNQIYSLEVLGCELDYLPQFISNHTNLYELNHLTQRLSALNQWEMDCFEGMVMMDSIQTQYAPIEVERLINMTHSMKDCHVVYEAHDDSTLGKFYADNDFVQKLENVPDEIYECLDFGKIGKEMREGEGGVFTPHGYVVQNGEIVQRYQAGDAISTEKPDYTILLRVIKGYPEHHNAPAAFLKLPADDMALQQAMKTVGVASPEECSFAAEDCMVPALTEKISDAIYESDGDCYGLVDELARQLKNMNAKGNLLTYKAMLKSAPLDITLEDALDLSYQTESFSVIREASTPAEYARFMLSKYCIECEKELFASADLYQYGKRLMKEKGVLLTEYGVLWSLTGQTVEQCLQRPDQHQGMEMK